MDNFSFSNWCRIACQDIVFTLDRKMVAQELREHMDDHYDALIAKGYSHEEATKMTMEAMGNPYILALQLAQVHHPFWGYLLRGIRIAIVVLLVILAIPGWKFLNAQDFNYTDIDDGRYPDQGYSIIYQAPTGTSFTDGDYTYTLSKAVLWENGEIRRLYFNINQTGLIPCTVTKNYAKYHSPSYAFWGVDNLGNYYGSTYEPTPELNIYTYRSQGGIFTWKLECWINNFPDGVQWIDIHYDREGRDHVIRIFLEGGSSK